MPRGKLIVIEGGDGSGKATQGALLLEFLKTKGKVGYFDFPQYGKTVFGDLTGRCLKGDYGDFLHISPYLSSLPYMLDRASAKDDILAALGKGNVVCNRYVTSNLGFQAAKLKGKERRDIIEFLEKGEYEDIGLPRPDLVIYLEVPHRVASAFVLKKDVRGYLGCEKAKDQHEADAGYQKEVAKVYKELAKERPGWRIISCVRNGKTLTPEAIHKQVLAVVKKHLNLK